jgi:hypothetical protein
MRYFRVFGLNDREPGTAELEFWARRHDPGARVSYRTDDRGWFEAELAFPELEERWQIDRFLAEEEGIRSELNSWAAWLETQEGNPHHVCLMRHMIATRQVFTVKQADDDEAGAGNERVTELCRRLAQITDGVYQIDRRGLFAADGTLLIQEQDE